MISTKPTLNHPLLLGDPNRLARKLNSASGLLAEQHRLFREHFLRQPDTRSAMIVLPAVLTGEGLDEARAGVEKFYRAMLGLDGSDGVQFHTWCYCGVALRQALFFDWLASRDVWSPADIDAAADAFLGFAYKHAYLVSLSRGRSSNNQIISMSLFNVVVGYLFGHKLTQRPTGKFLFEYGLGRLPELIGLFPGDGYGGEGSTYTAHVNTPLACWSIAFLREITGRDWADTSFQPNGTTLRRMLEMELRLLSPGGWLAPWDHYGWQPAINGAPFALLAHVTGDPRHLALIPALTDTKSPGYLAWGMDDPLWTLVWWPEEFKDYAAPELPADLFGWFLPKTGAALDDVPRRSRLMQVWDFCADTVAGIGRAQMNPNHLMFDYAGEPVFQDGVQDGAQDPWQYPVEQVFAPLNTEERQRFLRYRSSVGTDYSELQKLVPGITPGLIGVANAIVMDDEPWYWSARTCVGQPRAYARTDALQFVTADCAEFYRPRYDVTRVERTSLWSADGFGVVLDCLEAGSNHTWCWQVYLRPDVMVSGNTARIQLPNGKHVLLAWSPVAEVRTVMLEGFPNTQEKRSCRLELRQRGPRAQFTVVIAPEARSASVRRSGEYVAEVEIDGRKHHLDLTDLIATHKVTPPPADSHELPDITMDFEPQAPTLQAFARWNSVGRGSPTPPASLTAGLPALDACLAQLAALKPDVKLLLDALRSSDWPVQVAAADVLGRRGCREAAHALRELLRAEHADPNLYAPETIKRWRLKTALIVALGRLQDRESVTLLGQILADGRDFYCVSSVAAQALGRIGGPATLTALTPALQESETNTRSRAMAAREQLSRG